MSRPIKFRIWDKTKKCFPIDGQIYLIDAIKGYRKNLIAEQYTGLKDKNGVEIYEGDRIKIEGSDSVYTVQYGRGVWVARFGDESGYNICLYHYVRKDIVSYAEVIGNIHENPELLGGEE